MGERVEKIDANCKLDFRPQNQFALEFYKPSDDGYSTTGKTQNEEINRYIKESSERRAARQARTGQVSTRGAPIAADPAVADLTKDIRTSEAGSPAAGAEDGPELNIAARAKKQGRKDHISSLFQVPKMRPDSTTTRDAHVEFDCHGVDKEFHFKRNAYTEYTEDCVRYKHTMR